MTCWDAARRWKDWANSPRDVLTRDIHRYEVGDEDAFNQELRAIAALIDAHLEEFRGYLSGLAETVSLDQARRARRLATRNRDSYNRDGL